MVQVESSNWREFGGYFTVEHFRRDGAYIGSIYTARKGGRTKSWSVRSSDRGGGRIEFANKNFILQD